MHAGQIPTDVGLARRLITTQFPQWADLPVREVPSPGTVNALYRLGNDLVMRLPLLPRWDHQREHAWLPRLAPLLPVSIPEPVARGEPQHGYPVAWSIYRWIPGANPDGAAPERLTTLAQGLADFIAALRGIDHTGAPPGRASRLATQDEPVRGAIAELGIGVDHAVLFEAWEQALDASSWADDAQWIHGDLLPTNLLVSSGSLVGVLDFGEVGVGDPAWDLTPAWSIFAGASRLAFRTALDPSETDWRRGRGLALWQALTGYSYYSDTNPSFASLAEHMIRQIADDLSEAPLA